MKLFRGPRRADPPTPEESAPAGFTFAELKRAYSPTRSLDRRIVVLPGRRVVFVKVPKVASTTILAWLNRIHAGDPDKAIGNAHVDNAIPTGSQLGWRSVMPLLRGEAYRFAVVRDPYDRLESAYWNKIVGYQVETYRDRLRPFIDLPVGERPSFEQFLAALEAQDPVREMDPHWQPQHVVLMQPMLDYDRIGHLERFDADIALIQEEAGLPPMPVQPFNQRKRPDRPSVYEGRPDLRRRVQALFAEDFERYGYDA